MRRSSPAPQLSGHREHAERLDQLENDQLELCIAALCVAIDRLVEAVCQGTIDRESAKILVDVIAARVKAIDANDLEQRLTELEKAAATVDLPGSRNMRRPWRPLASSSTFRLRRRGQMQLLGQLQVPPFSLSQPFGMPTLAKRR